MGARDRILARRAAYRGTFQTVVPEGASRRVRVLATICAILSGDAEAFRATLTGVQTERVLADLHRFCHAATPTFDPQSDRISAFREGRREVWLRIQAHMRITDDQVRDLAVSSTEE